MTDYTSPETLKFALLEEDLSTAIRCINAGQNPMQLNDNYGFGYFFAIALAEKTVGGKSIKRTIRPQLYSLIALRKLVDLDEPLKSVCDEVGYKNSHPLMKVVGGEFSGMGGCMICLRKLHLLIQSGMNLNVTDSQGRDLLQRIYMRHVQTQGYNFYTYKYAREATLMLLLAGCNPKAKLIMEDAMPTVRMWFEGFLEAKNVFMEIFEDVDLERTCCSFIFNEKCLRNALGF